MQKIETFISSTKNAVHCSLIANTDVEMLQNCLRAYNLTEIHKNQGGWEVATRELGLSDLNRGQELGGKHLFNI